MIDSGFDSIAQFFFRHSEQLAIASRLVLDSGITHKRIGIIRLGTRSGVLAATGWGRSDSYVAAGS